VRAAPTFGDGPNNIDLGFDPEPFKQTGRLPMSIAFEGSLLRWHDPDYFWEGENFWKTFRDGPWKWKDRQRYAGISMNCGHYFSLAQDGADAEGHFYKLDMEKYSLLTVDAHFDAVLDLTYEDHLLTVGRKAFSNFEELPSRSRLMELLSYLVERERGGNVLTDLIGRWARSEGYDGILFFGARSLLSFPELVRQIEHGQDDAMGMPIAHGYFSEMRRTPSLLNIVLFSGAQLTKRIRSFHFPPGKRNANPYYNADDSRIDELLKLNAADEYEHGRGAFVGLLTVSTEIRRPGQPPWKWPDQNGNSP
jgi:hypothetical protein